MNAEFADPRTLPPQAFNQFVRSFSGQVLFLFSSYVIAGDCIISYLLQGAIMDPITRSGAPLSPAEEEKIRSRSDRMARHFNPSTMGCGVLHSLSRLTLFLDEEYAQHHVDTFLSNMNINPSGPQRER